MITSCSTVADGGLHYCLHCDAHMFVDQSVYVMGYGESAAHLALIMLNFADELH